MKGEKVMAVVVKSKKGKDVVLLNPSEKATKYVAELKKGIRFTNAGEVKVDNENQPLTLSDTQRAFRSGYLQSRTDGAKVYKAKKAKRKKSS